MRYLAFLGLSLLLSGCGSSIALVQYYRLPAVQFQVAEGTSLPRLVIEPVIVASYLNTNALVYQNNDVNMQLTRQHQWAEPLDQQLSRNLQSHLSAELQDWHISSTAVSSDDARLTVEVSQFHATAKGTVLISGKAHLLRGEQLKSMSFALELELTADGYDAVVSELGTGWARIAGQMAEMVKLAAAG